LNGQSKSNRLLVCWCKRRSTAGFRIQSWDRCYDLKKIFLQKKLAKILAFFAQATANCCKNLIITMGFEKNAIFTPKIGKNR
jgi:hypothetical protein